MIGLGGVGEAGAPTDAHELVNGAKVFFFVLRWQQRCLIAWLYVRNRYARTVKKSLPMQRWIIVSRTRLTRRRKRYELLPCYVKAERGFKFKTD